MLLWSSIRGLFPFSFSFFFLAGNQKLLDQGNSLPKLEEDLRLSLSDNEKITALWEEIKTHERLLQEKVDKRIEEERRLKVTCNVAKNWCVDGGGGDCGRMAEEKGFHPMMLFFVIPFSKVHPTANLTTQ